MKLYSFNVMGWLITHTKIGLFSTTERRYGIYSTYFYMFAYDAKEKQEVTTEIPLTKTTHNIKQKTIFRNTLSLELIVFAPLSKHLDPGILLVV